jgi:hypothetical protein
MKMSCQCFAEILIHFCFGKFLTLRVGHICSKVMPKKMTIYGSNKFYCLYIMRAVMVIMRERNVAIYLKHATDDILQNKSTEINCMC